MKEIYIIRHGQTEHNRNGIVQGKGVNLSLNETGKRQAQQFFEAHKNIPFDVVFTSTLTRAQETVSDFINRGIKHEFRSALDEISWGDMEGKHSVMDTSEEFTSLINEWKSGNLSLAPANGESPLILQARQKPFVEEIKQSDYKKILVCMHGRAMRSLLCTMTETSLSKMEDFPHVNLGLYKLNLENEKFVIELFNEQGHLK
ncbi:MAG TPA: histidine phosphatase family protein [Chitinophagales bacterium]